MTRSKPPEDSPPQPEARVDERDLPINPLLRDALDDVGAAVIHALETDVLLRESAEELLALAQPSVAQTGDESWTHEVDDRLSIVVGRFQSDPEISRLGLEDAIVAQFVSSWVIKTTTDEILPPPAEVRVRALPGIPSDTVWTLLREQDVELLRTKLQIGQTWVLMNEVDHKVWPRVQALVQYQRRVLGVPFGRPGRTKDSRSIARQALIDRIRAANRVGEPLSSDAISAEAWASGVWPHDAASDYLAIRKRVSSLRRAARED